MIFVRIVILSCSQIQQKFYKTDLCGVCLCYEVVSRVGCAAHEREVHMAGCQLRIIICVYLISILLYAWMNSQPNIIHTQKP